VSSRAEEKQRLRKERLAREQAEQAAAARRQRLQYAFGGVLAVALIAGLIVLATGLAGGSRASDAGAPRQASRSTGVELPRQQIGDLDAAATAAGCQLQNPPVEAASHETKEFKASDYKTNPPTSGAHNPDWYQDGIYEPGNVPRLGMLVHPLEHGRIELQYKPGTPAQTVTQLEALLAEQSGGYHMLMFQNTTGMKYDVAETAWGHLLGCPKRNDKVFDALRTFRRATSTRAPRPFRDAAMVPRVGAARGLEWMRRGEVQRSGGPGALRPGG
jgi:uncharacterized protein DUF3105